MSSDAFEKWHKAEYPRAGHSEEYGEDEMRAAYEAGRRETEANADIVAGHLRQRLERAEAQVAALREALQHVWNAMQEGVETLGHRVRDPLKDTEKAARELTARIRAETIERCAAAAFNALPEGAVWGRAGETAAAAIRALITKPEGT